MREITASIRRTDGVSPVIGVILMVALSVALATMIGVAVTSMDTPSENAPVAISIDQTQPTGTDMYTVSVKAISMENADRIIVRTPSNAQYFQTRMHTEVDHGLFYEGVSGGVRWAESMDDGRNRMYLSAPANDGTVNVTADFRARSYEDSGAALYARDADGNTHIVTCDGQIERDGNPSYESRPANLSEPAFTCANESRSYDWQGEYEVSAPAEIERVYLVTDLENVHGTFKDRAYLFDFAVTEPASGETNQLCFSCHAQVSSTSGSGNELTTAGHTVQISGLVEGEVITIVAEVDGKQTLIQTHTVG